MSVVIIGGNDRMQRVYCDACARYGCKAKIFMDIRRDPQKNRITGSFDFVYQHSLS